MPQLDPSFYASQVVWLVITFVALYMVMWRVVLPRIADVLETRRLRIEHNLEKAEALKKEAEAALKAYEKALAEARAEAHGVLVEAGARMAEQAAKQDADLVKKLARTIADSEAEIARAVGAAIGGIRTVTVELAQEAGQRLIGERVDAGAAGKAVDETIKGGKA
jgi:F-type H+-transporting ATPase subunit b